MMNRKAFTLVELLVVVLILGLLSSLAVGVFTTQVERARRAAARSDIATFALGVDRYQIDIGAYPPSGSRLGGNGLALARGCGYMQLALMHSMSGNSTNTSGSLWKGPYITVRKEKLGDINGTVLEELGATIDIADVQILDPWHQPYRFVRSGPGPDNYFFASQGTELPATHPFAATEKWYNPNSYQIVSMGNNNTTLPPPNYGMEPDDVTNFGQ